MNVCLILRGISGAGKSTKAQSYQELASIMGFSCEVHSTDDYWTIHNDGMFDAGKLGIAHVWNQNEFKESVNRQVQIVIVDNTNLSAWEMKPYVEMAQEMGYYIQLVIVDDPSISDEELARRNKHGVPIETIRKMRERFQQNITIQDILNSKNPFDKPSKVKDDHPQFSKEDLFNLLAINGTANCVINGIVGILQSIQRESGNGSCFNVSILLENNKDVVTTFVRTID